MAAQFFSSLADNALLIVAIARLEELHAPQWMTPLLKLFFVLSYVLLAAFVGAFADSMPKGRAMMITNTIKSVGCLIMLAGEHPLLAYGVVGFGAAAYSPAKYGILTELLPPDRLVAANGWIEGTTVASIIFGTAIGGMLINPNLINSLLALPIPLVAVGVQPAIAVVIGIYLLAALFNLFIPDTGARYLKQPIAPWRLCTDFWHCFVTLWRDKLGQISLAVTTLFWGAGAVLQFIILNWAATALDMSLSEAALLQVMVAVGVAVGAVIAATRIPLKRSLSVLPVGILIGGAVIALTFYRKDLLPDDIGLHIGRLYVPAYRLLADVFLIIVGTLCGFFVVPMNALLQHRGHLLLSAGHSIAVQNFNENLSVLVMLCVYALLIWLEIKITTILTLLGALVCVLMWLILRLHQSNQRQFDATALIGEEKH